MFDDDGSNFHTTGCLISRGCKISSFLTSSTSLFQSLVYHFLYKYPILLNFGHKLVIWDQCANFGLKIIIVYIYENPSINNKSHRFLFILTFFHSYYLPDISNLAPVCERSNYFLAKLNSHNRIL